MTEAQKNKFLESPESFFPKNLRIGTLLGNKSFIDSISLYTNILSESQYWPESRLEEIQLLRLRKLIRYAQDGSKFWSDYFSKYGFSLRALNSIKDLESLPVLSRNNLLELGKKIFISNKEGQTVFSRSSSGTTGILFRVLCDERYTIINRLAFHFRHPLLENISFSELFNRKPFVVLGRPGFRHICEKDFFSAFFPEIQPGDLDSADTRNKIYYSIEKAAPAFLVGFGSLITRFTEWVREDKKFLPLLAVRVTSEPISFTDKQMISDVLRVPVINLLSGNDVGVFAFECGNNPGYFHTNSEKIVLEVVNAEGISQGEKEGELIGTSFERTLNPVIRYNLNDFGKIISEKCSCGRTLPLFEFFGRRESNFILPSGKKIRMIHIYNSAMQAGLARVSKQLQIKQTQPNNMYLKIIPRTKVSEIDEVYIRLALTSLFNEEKVNIYIEYVDFISPGPGNKASMFIPILET